MDDLHKALRLLPMATTRQLSTLFRHYRHPAKRCSEKLREMERGGLLEGIRIETVEKVWRLTRKGRMKLGATYTTFPLTSIKRPHYLRIAELYFELLDQNLRAFDVEPRERFTAQGREMVYAPDVFAIFAGKPYLIEIQLKPRSRREWERKWEAANTFFDRGHTRFYKASWSKYANRPFIPQFMVITQQNPEIVRTGFNVQGRELIVRR